MDSATLLEIESLKFHYAKKKTCEQDPETVGPSKWTDPKWKTVLSEESKFEFISGIHERHALQTEEERDHAGCYQFKSLHLQ